jgi:serine/threonine protein kinase/Tol biopolymer transport system component
MTPARWRQIEDIYHASLGRADIDRAAFLDQACVEDDDLRREVESLLAQDASRTQTKDHSVRVTAETTLATATAAGFAPGSLIGSYKIDSQIGEGGMGVVYKAFDTKLNRSVAVKMLSDQLADAAARRRFQREAQTASSLNHPHIVTVYDAGELQGRQYLITEYIDGGTLREWSKAGRTWREIVELLTGVADGLATAHEANILHRDIKPANILVMKSGYAKLADFGLAKLAEESPGPTDATKSLTEQHTRPGMVVGTIAYMSPEQARGRAIDARSDVFSFGIVLYELLAAHRPFDGQSDLETLQKVIHQAPPPFGDHVPLALRTLVEKALKKDPGERYQSMREMVFDLRALARASAALPATEQPPHAASKRGNRPLLYSFAATALLAAVAAGAWYVFAPKGPVTIPSEFVQLTNFPDYATAPAISRDGSMVAFFRGGSYFLGTGQIYVKQLSSGESKQLTGDDSRKYNLAFTPDGSRVAYTLRIPGSSNWDTWTVPVLGGPPSRLMPNAAGLSWFGPDRIVFSEVMEGTAVHMGIVTARETRAEEREIYFPSHERAMAHYSYVSPDQRSVLIVEMDRVQDWLPCRLIPMDGTSTGAPVGPAGACTAAGWSPDGEWMYFNAKVDGGAHLWRQRFPDGVPEQITFGPTEEEGLAVAPDGKSLIASIGVRQSSVWVRDATGDHRLPVEGSASQGKFSADGKRLYYLVQKANSEDSIELWVRDLATGKSDLVLARQNIMDYDVSRDEKNVAFTVFTGGARAIYIASVDRSSAPRLLTKDGDLVSFASATDLIFRQSGETANYLARIHADGTGLERIREAPIIGKRAMSPDGEWVAVGGFTDPAKPTQTFAISLRDGTRHELCEGSCDVHWSLDGRILFVGLGRAPSDRRNSLSTAGRTLVIPLPRGLAAAVPDGGFRPDLPQQPNGVGVIPLEEVSSAFDAGTYSYTTAEFQGNLFRIPLH